MQGYFKNHTDEVVVFDAFYRKNPSDGGFAIAAGLEQVMDYIKNLKFSKDDVDYLRGLGTFDEDFLNYLADFRFTGDIYAIPEGTSGKSNCTYYGSTVSRNGYPDNNKSPESHRH